MNIVNKENLQRFFEGLKSKFVRTVNHQQMDENGNIDITHVESASNIVSSQDQVLSSTFVYRTTGGSTSINSGNATLIKLKGNTQLIDGTYVSTKPTSFESTGFNAFNNLSNSMILSDATITVVDGTATITASSGNIVCYCPCVCGVTDYIAYDSNCRIIMSGIVETLPVVGSTVTEIGTNLEPPQSSNYTTKSIVSPSGSGAKYIVVALNGTVYSQLQIHPRWSGKADETTEDYVAPSTIIFPTQGLVDEQTTNLPSWGLAKVNNTFDEMNIEDHVYIQRIGRETTSDSITNITSWEQGNISTVNGTDESSEFSCRTTEFYNFTNVPEGITLLIEDGYEVKAFIYNGESTEDYINSTNSMMGTVVLTPLDTQYYRFTITAIQEDETPIPLAPTDLSNDSLKFNERPPVSDTRIRDNTYDYYVLDEPVTYSISINGTYTANDYGTEKFIFGTGATTLNVSCEMLYGQNLVDKLRTDVLTISEQTLNSSQQSQVKNNLGIIESTSKHTLIWKNSNLRAKMQYFKIGLYGSTDSTLNDYFIPSVTNLKDFDELKIIFEMHNDTQVDTYDEGNNFMSADIYTKIINISIFREWTFEHYKYRYDIHVPYYSNNSYTVKTIKRRMWFYTSGEAFSFENGFFMNDSSGTRDNMLIPLLIYGIKY